MRLFDPVRDAIERYYDWCGSPAVYERAFPGDRGGIPHPDHFRRLIHRKAHEVGVSEIALSSLRPTLIVLLLTGGDRSTAGRAWTTLECARHVGLSPAIGVVTQHVPPPPQVGVPIEDVIEAAAAIAVSILPGVPQQDLQVRSPYRK